MHSQEFERNRSRDRERGEEYVRRTVSSRSRSHDVRYGYLSKFLVQDLQVQRNVYDEESKGYGNSRDQGYGRR